jgi:hypothetical protein
MIDFRFALVFLLVAHRVGRRHRGGPETRPGPGGAVYVQAGRTERLGACGTAGCDCCHDRQHSPARASRCAPAVSGNDDV